MRFLLAILAILLVIDTGYAATTPTFKLLPPTTYLTAPGTPLPDPCSGQYVGKVLFINGIWNLFEDAASSKATLAAFFSRYPDAQALNCIIVELGYNHKEWYFGDLAEAFYQFVGQETTQFWLLFSGVTSASPQMALLLEEELRESAQLAQALFDEGLALAPDDLSDFVQKAKNYTDHGKPVLIVGHSQGGFYANQVYRLVDNSALTATILVATPASKIEGSLEHVTIYGDIITLFVPGALRANTPNDQGFAWPWDIHQFVKSYMVEGSTSAKSILDQMVTFFTDTIKGPPSTKFSIDDTVEFAPDIPGSLLVWDLPDGTVIGTQEAGARGTVMEGPRYSVTMDFWMWQVDFDAGADGWVAEQFLRKISVSPGTPITDIDFADSNLRQCVLDAATASGWQSVEQVTALSCAGRNITRLAGLESFINLQTLALGDNQITDTAPLVNLTQLGQLDLTGNSGIRCMELDGLAATLSTTTITRPADCVQQSGNFVWPVTHPTRTQGYAAFNVLNNNKYHAGFDLISATGDLTVYAAAAGKVKTIPNRTIGDSNKENHGMGNVIIIDHNNGQGPFTLYAHLASITVADGVTVQAGSPIGVMGNTGCANLTDPCGVHLHFEVKPWGVLGNLHDDLGPHWGYTPGFPNLYGYLNPWPYLDHGWAAFSPRAVRSSADQIVRTGPSASEYTQILGNVAESQTFVASQQVGDWFEIDFPSEHGPAKGWIQATAASNVSRWKVTDPARGLIGVSVCPTTDACSSSSTRLSYVWDQQRIVELEQTPAQNGCSTPWIKTLVLDNNTGWVCGDFLMAESSSATGTGKLNDTGITWCANDTTNYLPCPVSGFPGQDGDHGRDALARDGQLQKVGGGAAGFDFTKLDANGNALPASATNWSCVRDNHTGLIWEVKTTSGLRGMDNTYTWYNPDPNTNGGLAGVQNGGACTGSACETHGYVQAVNQQGLCGASDWRLPTRRELLSIVHNGRYISFPVIDTAYFPNTPSTWFWSSSPYASNGSYTWYVHFGLYDERSDDDYYAKGDYGRVRLVRAGQ